MPTKINPLPPVEELRRLFNYDPETGILTNAIDRNARVKKGDKSGSLHKASGYWRVYVKGKWVTAHRVAWKIHYGYEPAHEIDHINRDRSDNRIENLRDITKQDNGLNLGLHPKSKISIRGVHWAGNRFRATKPRFKNQGNSNYLTSGSLLDCAAARISLENKLGIAA
jgi:hypothetical protein